ncbi:MAG: peptidase [Bacteroidetes bacterium QS_1_63_11]|nr:MAG: peptidase [Bacteroidetes bacterium QS_1_63_11]
MHRILFVFLDGIGLGPPGPDNPFSTHDPDALHRLSDGAPWTHDLSPQSTGHRLVRRLDATLRIEGLPQSGTGQASLFTGLNCAAQVGRHFGPFPHSATYEVLDHENLFHHVQALAPAPSPTAFANAFPPQFFDASSRRWTVTTRCCAGADVQLRDLDALQADRAVAADLTAQAWRDALHLDVLPQTAAQAAQALFATHRDHMFTLFEYFQTDKAGHDRGDLTPAVVLERLDAFFGRLLDLLDPTQDTLVVTSDHGNLEDTTHTQHTRHPVPLFVYGWAAPHFTEAHDLTDITPAIVEALRASVENQ